MSLKNKVGRGCNNPVSLYTTAVRSVVRDFERSLRFVDSGAAVRLTDAMRFDLYWESMERYKGDMSCDTMAYLSERFADLHTFYGLLGVAERRTDFHKMCKAVIEHQDGRKGPDEEPTLFIRLLVKVRDFTMRSVTGHRLHPSSVKRHLLDTLSFAQFLSESGWFVSAVKVLKVVENACQHLERSSQDHQQNLANSSFIALVQTETQMKLLHGYSAYCNFTEADKIYHKMTESCLETAAGGSNSCQTVTLRPVQQQKTQLSNSNTNSLPARYQELAYYCFVKSQFQMSYHWSMKAVGLLHKDLSPKIIVDVLRTASKSCVVRGLFSKAKLLIQEAVLLAKEVYSELHPKYADCLMDFGFYLQNSDGASASIQAYQEALEIRKSVFGGYNLLTALGHEDVAYATYVYEYSSGNFSGAIANAEKALEVMKRLLPENHLLMASAKRVCALILEEIAIDDRDPNKRKWQLQKAEQLHLCALALSTGTFGEMNIQTAKHYGNLGRLYQSMEQCKKAEKMHLKAIHIKEQLLGKDDYEVALSVGHLASLYNYDMREYDKAEELHIRSINLGVKLFGEAYSGLEYDYRGLMRIYQDLEDLDKFYEYQMKLSDWRDLRYQREQASRAHLGSRPHLLAGEMGPSKPIGHIVKAVISEMNKSDLKTKTHSDGESSQEEQEMMET